MPGDTRGETRLYAGTRLNLEMDMSSRTRLGLAMLTVVVAVFPARAQSGHDLFQQALVSERNDAQLGEAIALYRRIADQFAADRQLAAQALLRLGGIYEITGSPDATATYQRLLRDFTDQRPEAAAARQRLAELQPPPGSPADPPSRRLILDTEIGSGRVTRDGQHLLRYDAKQHTFELADIGSERVRRLVHGLDRDTAAIDFHLFVGMRPQVLSRDGKKIAAVLPITVPGASGGPLQPVRGGRRPQTTRWELREFVVGTDGDGRMVYTFDGGEFGSLRPFDWSPDGSRIWLWGLRRDQSAVIASVGVDGTFEVLKTLAWRNHTQQPSLSPDGRFIAYHDVDNREAPADIFVISTDGTREYRVEHPAQDAKPLFAPDGSGVVFESDRREGIQDLWFLPLADGRPTGAARVVWRDVAPYGTARAFAQNGSLFYYFASSSFEIFVSDLDIAAGTISEPKLIPSQGHEMNEAPAFSPDGRYLAHMRGRRRLVVRDLNTGAEREFPTGELLRFPMIDWCQNGDVAFVTGYRQTSVALRVDLEQGGAEPVRLADAERVLCVGTGNDIVYLQAPSVRGGPRRIVRRSLATGAEQTLYEGNLVSYQMNRSNDGATIAFVQRDAEQANLTVVSATGGKARSVAAGRMFHGFSREWAEFGGVMWSPGGDALLVTRSSGNEGSVEPSREVTLSRIRVSDGAEVEVGHFQLPEFPDGFVGAINWAMNPTGSSFAFQRHTGTAAQVWAIDNLLAFIQSGETAAPTPTTRGN